MEKKQHILVFDQDGSSERKITAIAQYGKDRMRMEIYRIKGPLPSVIDDSSAYLPEQIEADLVLDYLKHPDLSDDLARLCARDGVPVVASGKKLRIEGLITPPTCCGLARLEKLGPYGERFGAPEFKAEVDENDRLIQLYVERGAPCGATWDAAQKVLGLPAEEAAVRIGLETQFFCSADPAGWDPIYGKSPVHFAGNVHAAALARALGKNTEKES